MTVYKVSQSEAKLDADAARLNQMGQAIIDRQLHLESFDELANQAAPTAWLVDEMLSPEEAAVLLGESGALKSFIALYLLHCIADGEPFFGHKVYNSGKVLYICGEGKNGLKRRLKALKNHVGKPLGNNAQVVHEHICIDDPLDLERLRQALGAEPWLLVVVDTFSSTTRGTDENAASSVAPVISALTSLCRSRGSALMIVHHTGKNRDSGSRGSYVFHANVDVEWTVERIGYLNSMLKLTKNKDGAEDETGIKLMGVPVELGFNDLNGKPATSLVVQQIDVDYSEAVNNSTNEAAVKLKSQVAKLRYLTIADEISQERKEANQENMYGEVKPVTVGDIKARLKERGLDAKSLKRSLETLRTDRYIEIHIDNEINLTPTGEKILEKCRSMSL